MVEQDEEQEDDYEMDYKATFSANVFVYDQPDDYEMPMDEVLQVVMDEACFKVLIPGDEEVIHQYKRAGEGITTSSSFGSLFAASYCTQPLLEFPWSSFESSGIVVDVSSNTEEMDVIGFRIKVKVT